MHFSRDLPRLQPVAARSLAPRRWRPACWHAVLLLTLAGALLRLHHLGQQPFSRNEVFGLYWTRHSFAYLLGTGLFQETNPPLQFLLLKAWTALFGTGEFAVRSLSALASIACIPLVYRLGLELRGARIGLIAAGLLAISPLQIVLAQEARIYVFMPLLAAAAMLGLGRFLRAWADGDRRAARHGLLLYAAAALALLYSHAIAVLLLAALAAAGLLRLRRLPAPRAGMLAFLTVNLAAGLLAAPVLVAMACQTWSPNIDWIPPLSAHTPLVISHYLMLGPMTRGDLGEAAGMALLFTELGLGVALSLLLAVFAWRAIDDSGARALLLVFPLLFLLLTCAVSLARPILEPRIVAWMSVPICLAFACLLTAPATARRRPAIAALLAGATLIGLCNNVAWPAVPNPDWRGFARDIGAGAADAPMLVAGPHAGPLGVAFYAQGLRTPLRQWVLTADHRPSNAEIVALQAAGAAPITTAAIAAMLRAGIHLRLFLDNNDCAELAPVLAALPGFAAARRQDYPGLHVYSWLPPPAAGPATMRKY